MRTALSIFSFIACLLVLSPSVQANTCQSVYKAKKAAPTWFMQEMKRLVDVDLFALRENEAQTLRSDQIHSLNKQVLQGLRDMRSDKQEPKSLSYDEAQNLINRINDHPVYGSYGPYERPGVSIGYCFGRAYGAHMLAIDAGFSKDQIRKLWIVGPMDSGWNQWQFHVATIVRDGNGTWWVIDTFTGKPMIPEEWFAVFKKQSTDNKLRLYATNPEKFAPTAGKYSRLQMGLDMKKPDDFYLNYFKDGTAHDRSEIRSKIQSRKQK